VQKNIGCKLIICILDLEPPSLWKLLQFMAESYAGTRWLRSTLLFSCLAWQVHMVCQGWEMHHFPTYMEPKWMSLLWMESGGAFLHPCFWWFALPSCKLQCNNVTFVVQSNRFGVHFPVQKIRPDSSLSDYKLVHELELT